MYSELQLASVFAVFREVASAEPQRMFLRSPAGRSEGVDGEALAYTYGDAFARVERLGAGYAALGISAGARVALALDSSVDVYLHLLALNALGGSAVPLNMAATDAEIRYLVAHSDSRLVVVADEHRERVRAILGEVDDCRACTNDELARAAANGLREAAAEARAEAALLYTSGTTGRPKGCMLSNDYFLTLGRWYSGLGGQCRLEPGDRLLTPLPPNHMNALCTSFMGMLMCGGCVIQLDRFHPRSWWQTVRDEQATIIHYLGVMPAILLRLPETGEDNVGDQVKFGFGAGADPRHHAAFERRFGFPLIEAWAMTESGAGGLTVADREPRHVGERSIGRPVKSMEYRIVDEQDRDVARGEPGELLVRARGSEPRKGYFSGYYKDEAATEHGWRGGWWHTGDVVRAGTDDSLHFVDRRKNVIRRSGENIAAVEVEAVLLQHPAVANCAVTAVPDEIRGDEVFAFVVIDGEPDGVRLAESIVTHCLASLSYFKVPGYVAFETGLPLTASQKVARGEVRERARHRLETRACFDLRAMKSRDRRSGTNP